MFAAIERANSPAIPAVECNDFSATISSSSSHVASCTKTSAFWAIFWRFFALQVSPRMTKYEKSESSGTYLSFLLDFHSSLLKNE